MNCSPSLLLIDDNVSLTSTYRTLLAEQGFAVAAACSGEQAVTWCSEEKRELAVAVVDMRMPGLDGPRTIQALRACTPALKIIAISGGPLSPYFAQLSDLGVRHFLPKPFCLQGLLEGIQEVLQGSAAASQAA